MIKAVTSYCWRAWCFALISAALLACGLQQEKSTLTVDITSFLGDSQQFANDDKLQFLISVNETAWLYLYYQNAEGKLYQLIPSVLYPDNQVSAGDFLPFPAADAPFHLAVSAPYGDEQVWLVATKKALPQKSWQKEDLQELPFTDLATLKTKVFNIADNTTIAHDHLRFSTVESM